MTFNAWQDVLHDAPDGTEIRDFHRDDFDDADKFYLDMELTTRNGKKPITGFISQLRGVGNWIDPKVVLVDLEVTSPLGMNSPKWETLKVYRRLRPYCRVSIRPKIQALLQAADLLPQEVYLMVAQKGWLAETTSIDLLKAELAMFGVPIICDGLEAFQYTKRFGTAKCLLLPDRADSVERRTIFKRMVQK